MSCASSRRRATLERTSSQGAKTRFAPAVVELATSRRDLGEGRHAVLLTEQVHHQVALGLVVLEKVLDRAGHVAHGRVTTLQLHPGLMERGERPDDPVLGAKTADDRLHGDVGIRAIWSSVTSSNSAVLNRSKAAARMRSPSAGRRRHELTSCSAVSCQRH